MVGKIIFGLTLSLSLVGCKDGGGEKRGNNPEFSQKRLEIFIQCLDKAVAPSYTNKDAVSDCNTAAYELAKGFYPPLIVAGTGDED